MEIYSPKLFNILSLTSALFSSLPDAFLFMARQPQILLTLRRIGHWCSQKWSSPILLNFKEIFRWVKLLVDEEVSWIYSQIQIKPRIH
jgi:hypothetical protein